MGLPIGAPSPSHLLPPSSSFEPSSDSAMASGVKLSDAVKHAYDDIKKHQKYLYAIFVIKDGEILVEKTVTKQAGSDLCRYAFYDYEYQFNPQGGDSVMRSKLFL